MTHSNTKPDGPNAVFHAVGRAALGAALLIAASATGAVADDLAAERAKLLEVAEMLADQPSYWAEVPLLDELAGTWGLSERDCENAKDVDFRILHLASDGLRVGELNCSFSEITRHESGLSLIVEADCVEPKESGASVFALAALPDGQISIFEGQSGTNYMRCE